MLYNLNKCSPENNLEDYVLQLIHSPVLTFCPPTKVHLGVESYILQLLCSSTLNFISKLAQPRDVYLNCLASISPTPWTKASPRPAAGRGYGPGTVSCWAKVQKL